MSAPHSAPASPWKVSPEALPPLDADIVRSIAGELTDSLMQRMLGRENFVVRRRLSELLRKHACGIYSDLAMLSPERRRQLAEEIVTAELAERELDASVSRELPRSTSLPPVDLPHGPVKNCEPS